MSPRPSASDRSAAGPRPEVKAFSVENARAQMTRIIWDRKSSETTIVGYWRYVPLVAVSLAALAGFAFFVLVPSLFGFVFGYLVFYSVCFAILAIINYKLVRAMNAHFRREASLRTQLIDIARHRAGQSPSPEVKEALSRMERADMDASKRERPQNEMMPAMSALPVVGIVFGYAFLRSTTVARAEHDRNWNEILTQLHVAGARSGKEPAVGDVHARKSNFWPYFAISLLFFPFLAYWYYDIERRTQMHLQEQWRSEDQLAKGLP